MKLPYILQIGGHRNGKMTELVAQTVAAVREAMPDEVIVRGDIDAAWGAVEAALPAGWTIQYLDSRWSHVGWKAQASFFDLSPNRTRMETVEGEGATPAAALTALAEKLRMVLR